MKKINKNQQKAVDAIVCGLIKKDGGIFVSNSIICLLERLHYHSLTTPQERECIKLLKETIGLACISGT